MYNHKIKKISDLKKIIQELKLKGKKIVFTNGCFDLLHYGHIKYLEDAKAKGDVLVVAINSDHSVREIKGELRPITKELDRTRIVAALETVDYVTIFNEPTPIKVIKTLKPDTLVKGGDWKKNDIVGADFVKSYGGQVKIVSFIKNYSTTDIFKKIVKRFK